MRKTKNLNYILSVFFEYFHRRNHVYNPTKELILNKIHTSNTLISNLVCKRP
jgi:hypothetical protein